MLKEGIQVLKLTMLALGTCLFQYAGTTTVNMFQVDNGTRSIGSYVSVVSEITNGSDHTDARLLVQPSGSHSFSTLYTYFSEWSDASKDETVFLNNVAFLNISAGAEPDLTRIYNWNFSFLPENYSNMLLTTQYSDASGSSIIQVSSCKSPNFLNTYKQDDIVKITSQSNGYFNDIGNCSCTKPDQELFYINGTKASGIVTCGLYADWLGCDEVQCWSGPKNIEATQVNYSANALNPFNCNFTEGFPTAIATGFKVNNEEISQMYALKSSDNGKSLSCHVTSGYTEVVGETYKSRYTTITVYYSPENATVSANSLTILMKDCQLLNYSFSANPENGEVQVVIQDETSQDSPPGLFHLTTIYSHNTTYIYEFSVTVNTSRDYGSYNICASTESPSGKSCSTVVIRNVAIPTTEPVSTDFRKTPTLSSLAIGLIAGGVIVLIMAIVIVTLMIQRRKNKEAENVSETDGNQNVSNTEYANFTPNKDYEEITPNYGYENVELRNQYEDGDLH